MRTKRVDSKGRLLIGSKWANRLVIIDDSNPNRIVVRLAEPIPPEELWLYKNKEALRLVRAGLEQARRREFCKTSPDLEADADLADQDGYELGS